MIHQIFVVFMIFQGMDEGTETGSCQILSSHTSRRVIQVQSCLKSSLHWSLPHTQRPNHLFGLWCYRSRYSSPHLMLLTTKVNKCQLAGDVGELHETPLVPGSLAAFSDDCHSGSAGKSVSSRGENRFAGRLNFNNPAIVALDINPVTCTFSTGVFLTSDVDVWRKEGIWTKVLDLLKANEMYVTTQKIAYTFSPLSQRPFGFFCPKVKRSLAPKAGRISLKLPWWPSFTAVHHRSIRSGMFGTLVMLSQ